MKTKSLLFGIGFMFFIALVCFVSVYAINVANVNIRGTVTFEAIGNVRATVKVEHTSTSDIIVKKNNENISGSVLNIEGNESSVQGDFFLGDSNNNILLTPVEGATGDQVYYYTITISNNYTSTDQADKKDLKITFTPPEEDENISIVLVQGEWQTDANGKKIITIAEETSVKIRVVFTTDALVSNTADIASSLTLEIVNDNNAQRIPQAWDKSIAATFAGGTGSAEDPYLIKTASQLALMGEAINSLYESYNGFNVEYCLSAHYKLIDNIILNEENIIDENGNLLDGEYNVWKPIGRQLTSFDGVFDGNSKSISGIYINSTNNYQGLFANNNGIIKNLTVKKSYVKGGAFNGGIAGVSTGEIINSINEATIVGGSQSGGIAGAGGGVVTNCLNKGKVSGTLRIGGIQGDNNSGTYITNCINIGQVTGTSSYVGSICGASFATIKNSYYLAGTAIIGESFVQNGVGTYSGYTNDDVQGKTNVFGDNGNMLNEASYTIINSAGTEGVTIAVGESVIDALNLWVASREYKTWSGTPYPTLADFWAAS